MSLGSILVRLTMNTADFETDAGRAAKIAEKRAKEIDAAFSKMGAAVGVALGTAVAGAAAGLVAATKEAIDFADQMDEMSQRLQISTETLSGWSYAAKLTGTSFESLTNALPKLSKNMAAALDEGSKMDRLFEALGIKVADSTGHLRRVDEVLPEIADKFKALDNPTEEAALAMELFGKSGAELLEFLNRGSSGIKELTDRAAELGVVIDSDTAQAAAQFKDRLDDLKTAGTGLGLVLASDLLPQMTELVEWAIKFVSDGDNARTITDSIATAIDGLGSALSGAISLATAFANAMEEIGIKSENSKTGVEDLARTIGDVGRLLGSFGDRIGGGIDELTGRLTGDASLKAMGVYRQRQAIEAGRRALYGQTGADSSNVLDGSERWKNVQSRVSSLSDTPNLNKFFAGGPDKPKKAQLTEEQKAAQALERAYQSLNDSLSERNALFGDSTELAKLNYEIESGSLKGLDAARQQELRSLASALDAREEEQKLIEDGKRLIEESLEPWQRINAEREKALELLKAGVIAQEDYNKAVAAHRTPAEQMIADLQFETELLGKSREQQELLNLQRQLGGEASTAAGKQAISALDEYLQKAKEVDEQIQAMDGIRDAFGDFFTSVIDGSKSAKDAFKDLISDILAQLTRMMVNKAIEQMFGAYGTTGAGTAGGGWLSQLLGAFASSGGAKAYGGSFGPNRVYRIAEDGPEVVNVSGRSYMVTGSHGGTVTPNHRLPVGGASVTQNITVAGRMTRRTEERLAQLSGREAARAMARTGR